MPSGSWAAAGEERWDRTGQCQFYSTSGQTQHDLCCYHSQTTKTHCCSCLDPNLDTDKPLPKKHENHSTLNKVQYMFVWKSWQECRRYFELKILGLLTSIRTIGAKLCIWCADIVNVVCRCKTQPLSHWWRSRFDQMKWDEWNLSYCKWIFLCWTWSWT